MLAEYLKRFSHLRTDKDRNRWSALTTHQAPHKPFVLLSVMDLIAQGTISENFIEPSFELLDTFNLYFANIMPPGSKGNMAYPFPRLKTDSKSKDFQSCLFLNGYYLLCQLEQKDQSVRNLHYHPSLILHTS